MPHVSAPRRCALRSSCGAAAALAVWTAVAVLPAGEAAGIRDCQVSTPSGAYAQAILEFDVPERWTYVGALRDGRMRVDHGIGITREGGWLELKDGRLTGKFERPAGAMGAKVRPKPVAISVDARVEGGAISGTCTVDGKSGKIAGRLQTESELAAANPVPRERGWPAYLGPVGAGCAAEPTGAALIGSLTEARLVWRSEEPVGNNMGSINRFMQKWASASTIRTSGQSASPVLADGRVFIHQRIPAGTETSLKHGNVTMDMAEVKAAGFDEVPFYAKEKLLTRADEVVTAMDAATGKTLWRAVLPLRAPNIQHHKDRGGCRTPAVVGDVLVCLGYEAGLFGFAAATGKPLWETKAGKGKNPAVVAAGKVAVAPAPAGSWAGFDAATGRQLWQLPGMPTTGTVPVWRHQDRHYVLATSSDKEGAVTLSCVEAASGTVAWSMPLALHHMPGSYFPSGLTVHGDTLLAFEWAGAAPKGSGKESDDDGASGAAGARQMSAYRLTPAGAEKRWSVKAATHRDTQPLVLHGRFAVCMASRDAGDTSGAHQVVDIASGKVVGSTTGPGPGNGGYAQAMEDLVLVRHDGTHGVITITAYRVTPEGAMTKLDPEAWGPPVGGSSTSYHHPVMYPVVDGRLFMRQLDGIYCWDLRRR